MNIIVFLVSVFIGIIIGKQINENNESETIVVEPNPENVKDHIYIDDNGVCYKYDIISSHIPINQ